MQIYDDVSAVRLCGRGWCAEMAAAVFKRPSASDVAAKRAQRDAVLAAVAGHLACWEARAAAEGWVAPPRRGTAARPLCVYVFDDFLNDVTFTAELVARFGARVRVFTPNLKFAVVAALRATLGATPGQVMADWACYEAFNTAHADAIRGAGGLDVIFADCFGSFKNGAGPLFDDFVARRLFAAGAGQPYRVTPTAMAAGGAAAPPAFQPDVDLLFAVSGLAEVLSGEAPAPAKHSVKELLTTRLPKCFETDPERRHTCVVEEPTPYSRTMNFMCARVREVPFVVRVDPNPPANSTCFQMMIPYNAKVLRCDPMWSQLSDNHLINNNMLVRSHCLLRWTCSECTDVFEARVDNFYISCGRCPLHRQAIKKISMYRERYKGDVPKPILRPIRAGILQDIGTDQLIALIATLEPVPSQCAGAADSAGAALAMARGHVESIAAGNYTRVQLLDSVFWGDDTVTRKDGSRYVRPMQPKKKRPDDAEDTGNNAAPPAVGAVACSAPAPRRRRLIPLSPH